MEKSKIIDGILLFLKGTIGGLALIAIWIGLPIVIRQFLEPLSKVLSEYVAMGSILLVPTSVALVVFYRSVEDKEKSFRENIKSMLARAYERIKKGGKEALTLGKGLLVLGGVILVIIFIIAIFLFSIHVIASMSAITIIIILLFLILLK